MHLFHWRLPPVGVELRSAPCRFMKSGKFRPGSRSHALSAFLNGVLDTALEGELQVELLSGGRSNLTYTVRDASRQWVLRRPPLGHVLETAHDMGREYRVMAALADTGVPVPEMIGFCPDPDVMGAPFYVMEKVDGIAYRDAADFESLDPCRSSRPRHGLPRCDECVGGRRPGRGRTLRLRTTRGLCRPPGPALDNQLSKSTSRDNTAINRLERSWPAACPPAQRASIVHGDFRLDNALVHRSDPGTVLAIIDWEMSTLGDPLTDLGMLYLFWEGWRGPGQPHRRDTGRLRRIPQLGSLRGPLCGGHEPRSRALRLVCRLRVLQARRHLRRHPLPIRQRPHRRGRVRADRRHGRHLSPIAAWTPSAPDGGPSTDMDFSFDAQTEELRRDLTAFMDEHVYPSSRSSRRRLRVATSAGNDLPPCARCRQKPDDEDSGTSSYRTRLPGPA